MPEWYSSRTMSKNNKENMNGETGDSLVYGCLGVLLILILIAWMIIYWIF